MLLLTFFSPFFRISNPDQLQYPARKKFPTRMATMEQEHEIHEVVEKYKTEIQFKTREQLSIIFSEMMHTDPHPKFPREFIEMVILRKFQDDLWIKRTGSIPEKIRKASINFWTIESFPFLNKEGVKAEKNSEIVRKKVVKTSMVEKIVKSSEGIRDSIIRIEDKDVKAPSYATSIIDIINQNKELSYNDLEKICKKKKVKLSMELPVILVALEGKGCIKIDMPKEVINDSVQKVVEEPLVDVKSVIKDISSNNNKNVILGEVNFPQGESCVGNSLDKF
jgi:hypothetical protein